ncbi:hypothetical protein LZP73_16085 [Shewanella sp. AS16]|uniref:hypothetical protein n=1 Tax=Shewanella sp. AS16 TaxID=2907625 RepID=UPI001F1EB99A|nr:hypothetical protein [Shewanella sp. AS16]MCE9687701.1 hypothetical protein [Shewanella sp. AS16]
MHKKLTKVSLPRLGAAMGLGLAGTGLPRVESKRLVSKAYSMVVYAVFSSDAFDKWHFFVTGVTFLLFYNVAYSLGFNKQESLLF